MKRDERSTINRRLAIGGGLAAATGLAAPGRQIRGRVVTQRGIAGGGLVRFAEGEAQFSLFASSLTFDEGEGEGEPIFLGRLLWVDGSVGLTLASTRITNYENPRLPDRNSRTIEGFVTAGDAGEHPFVMDVVLVDPPGSGADRVTFTVGAASVDDAATPADGSGFTYAADGAIVVGDVQDVDFAVNSDTGDVTEPEPV